MKPKLIINDHALDKYRLTWQFEDDIGGNLGDSDYFRERDLPKLTGEERTDAISYFTAGKTDAVEHDSIGFWWPTRRGAADALRAIKLAVKLDSGGPLPEWAIKALAAGFSAPKNWKP